MKAISIKNKCTWACVLVGVLKNIGGLLGACVMIALVSITSRAEDFSVHIKNMAEIDSAHSLPEYKLDRVLQKSGTESADMPEKTFDVFIRFKKFGDVRLDEAGEAGPSTGKTWAKGMTFCSGLADLKDVRMAWIKDSPGFFIVAWVNEPDGRGNGNAYGHSYAVLQLKDRRARILLRGRCSITGRLCGGIQEGMLDYSRFSFNPKQNLLEECVSRSYEIPSETPHDLGHPWKDESGQELYVASINETITIKYKLVEDKLVPQTGSLVYKTQKQDTLSEIAHFYLGPSATGSKLLDANANLAKKYKDAQPGTTIWLDEGQEIRVPVTEKWFVENFRHELTLKQGNE